MLRRRCPLHYEHLLLSDSETESDDLSEKYKIRLQKINEEGRIIATECDKSKKDKRKIGIQEESRRDTKAHKEDPGLEMIDEYCIYFESILYM